jgi:hypothetical protein
VPGTSRESQGSEEVASLRGGPPAPRWQRAGGAVRNGALCGQWACCAFLRPPPPPPGFEWGAGGGSVSTALVPRGPAPAGRPPQARVARGDWVPKWPVFCKKRGGAGTWELIFYYFFVWSHRELPSTASIESCRARPRSRAAEHGLDRELPSTASIESCCTRHTALRARD